MSIAKFSNNINCSYINSQCVKLTMYSFYQVSQSHVLRIVLNYGMISRDSWQLVSYAKLILQVTCTC